MSKMNIDNFFRNNFLEHERNMESYSPEQWKNFEQLLDKEMPNKKNNKKGFLFNNILLFMLSLVIIISPLFFMHSDKAPVVAAKNGHNMIQANKLSASINQIHEIKNDNHEITEEVIPSENTTKPVRSDATIHINNNELCDVIKPDKEISSGISFIEELENDIDLCIPAKPVNIKYTSTLVVPSVKSKNTKNYLKQVDTNNTKKGKIKRSKVLVPHFNYNGF